MTAPEISAAEERAIDEHIKSLWECIRTGCDVAIVHRGAGMPGLFLPAWEDLDDSSQFAFMALAMGPLSKLIQIADAITAELGNPAGGDL